MDVYIARTGQAILGLFTTQAAAESYATSRDFEAWVQKSTLRTASNEPYIPIQPPF